SHRPPSRRTRPGARHRRRASYAPTASIRPTISSAASRSWWAMFPSTIWTATSPAPSSSTFPTTTSASPASPGTAWQEEENGPPRGKSPHDSSSSWAWRFLGRFLTSGSRGPKIRPRSRPPFDSGGHMKRQALTGAVLVVSLLLLSLPALAQSPAGMQLYVFTSGSLGGFPKAALQMGGQGNIDWAPVAFYVIKHPKGNVMFDTGNNDKTITNADGWWGPLAKGFGLKMTQSAPMAAQLSKIGLTPADIKYVAVGHMHLDHGGNISALPNATFIVQNDEMKAACGTDTR